MRNLLDDAEFVERRAQMVQEQLRLAQQREQLRKNSANRFEPVEDALFFRNQAVEWFRRGNLETKKLILETVGSNLSLSNKILSVEARKPFKQRLNDSTIRELCGFIDDVRRALLENPEEAALIERNVKLLRAHFEQEERKAA